MDWGHHHLGTVRMHTDPKQGVVDGDGKVHGIANLFVMQRTGSKRSYDRQRTLITELVSTLVSTAPESLEPHLRPTWDRAADDGARLRVVVDQVASLTDISLVTWHKRLCR